MEKPLTPLNTDAPEEYQDQDDGDNKNLDSLKNCEQQEEIMKTIGEIRKFTGNKTIHWDVSVTKSKDQKIIQELGAYFVVAKTDLPEILKNNIDKTASRIREREVGSFSRRISKGSLRLRYHSKQNTQLESLASSQTQQCYSIVQDVWQSRNPYPCDGDF